MKRIIAALCTGMLLVFGVALTASATDEPEEPTTVSNEVVGSPDNHCPAWARDDFTRTLTITPLAADADSDYHVRSDISGTWTETADTPAVGTITGYVEYNVSGELDDLSFDGETVDLSEHGCKSDVPDEFSASDWALNYFADGAETHGITEWEYVYAQDCSGDEVVENDESGAVGADTFAPCKVKPELPTVTDPTCDAPGELVLADTPGVTYDVEDKGDKWKVVATPEPGWTFYSKGDRWKKFIDKQPATGDCPTPTPTPTGEPDPDPTDTPTPDPTTEPTDDDTPSSTPSEEPDPDPSDPGNEAGDGETLPDTGVSVLLAVLGSAAAAGGGGMMWLRRRV